MAKTQSISSSLLKFRVRPGFVVHHSEIREYNGRREVVTKTFGEGEAVDFTPAQAREHLHKLEPGDSLSADFLESHVLSTVQASAGVPNSSAPKAEDIAAATVAALINAGVIKPADVASAKS